MVVGGMTMSRGFISSAESATDGLQQLQINDQQISRTYLEAIGGSITSDTTLEVTLRNSGQTKLSNFDKWDFIVQYRDASGQLFVYWLPFTEGTPDVNQWSVSGIYLNASLVTPEEFEPDIMNPSEEIILIAALDPAVGADNAVQVTVSTPNGIQAPIIVTR